MRKYGTTGAVFFLLLVLLVFVFSLQSVGNHETRAAEAAVQNLMETVVSLGGAISGEHGIGLAKTPFLRLQHNPAQIRAMQAIKKALDPRGILNPGKMFQEVRIWKYPKLQLKLPWDHK